MLCNRLKFTAAALTILLAGGAGVAEAVNIRIDYTYDANNFFGAGNPSGATAGAAAKASLESAASYLSGILHDTLSAVVTPAPFSSSFFDGTYSWQWQATFTNPATGANVVLTNPPIAADEYVIYAGARAIAGSTLGIGGPGGFGWQTGGNGGGFTSEEIDQLNATTDAFSGAVERRDEPVGEFATWGGSITFDRDGSTAWHYNSTTPVASGTNDFYSVALHELTHALGFGTANEWIARVSGGVFTGPAAIAANGNVAPAVNGGHWANGTNSTVYGTTTAQETAMDPDLLTGTRKVFTTLDAAGLADIGWDVQPPTQPAVSGDFDGDRDVDGADFLVWQRTTPPNAGNLVSWKSNFGTVGATLASANVPEPSAVALVALALAASIYCRVAR